MFYIRSSATMRRKHIKRLEPKLSDQSVTSLSERQNHIRFNMKQEPVHTSTEGEKHNNSENRKYSTPSGNPESPHQSGFSGRKPRILSVQNISITKERHFDKAGYSIRLNYPKHNTTSKTSKNEMKIAKTTCKQTTNTDKVNCPDKKKKLNVSKPFTKEVKVISSKSTNKSEQNQRNFPIKPKESVKNLSKTFSTICSTKLSEMEENKTNKSHYNPRFFPVQISNPQDYSEQTIEYRCNDRNFRKNQKEIIYQPSHGRVSTCIAFKSKNLKDSFVNCKCEKASLEHKSDILSKYHSDNNKITEMINFSETTTGACDINRNGSGDSESLADNSLQYYASKTKHLDMHGISKLELEKLERFRRINLKIIEAVSNTSDSKFPSVLENDTDEFDEVSEIESLEDMRRKAMREEEEEILHRCALEACTFLESNFPHYFQHLIKRYQLDVRTSDHFELRTRKEDIIRIASQNNKKLQDMENVYSK